MKKAKLLFLLLFAGLVLAQVTLAKGPPQKVTISAPNLAEEIVITDDEATLNVLGTMMLEDFETRSEEAPDVAGEGYLITRYFENSAGREFAFDEVQYFPVADGERGYVHYLGIVNGSSEYDGDWFRPNPEGEAVLQAVIAGEERAAEPQASAFAALVRELMLLVAAQ